MYGTESGARGQIGHTFAADISRRGTEKGPPLLILLLDGRAVVYLLHSHLC